MDLRRLRFGFSCRLWLWLFRVGGGFVFPSRWFAFGVGRAAYAAVSFVQVVAPRLMSVARPPLGGPEWLRRRRSGPIKSTESSDRRSEGPKTIPP